MTVLASDVPSQIGMPLPFERREYERRYTPEQNYRMLTEVYRGALERRHGAIHAIAAPAPGITVPAPESA